MYELRRYHGDRVQSLTYDNDELAFSVGIISPGEYQFGSIKKELFTVTSGSISCWTEDSDEWTTYSANETFSVSQHKNFKLKVDNVSSYICFYE